MNRNRHTRRAAIAIGLCIALGLTAVAAFGTTRLMKLKEDLYLVTHQKQSAFGGQGKALRMAYEKAGSLCVVLGYEWFEITETESKGRTFGSGAATTMELKFYHEEPTDVEDDDLFECEPLATPEQKGKMLKALEKIGEKGKM